MDIPQEIAGLADSQETLASPGQNAPVAWMPVRSTEIFEREVLEAAQALSLIAKQRQAEQLELARRARKPGKPKIPSKPRKPRVDRAKKAREELSKKIQEKIRKKLQRKTQRKAMERLLRIQADCRNRLNVLSKNIRRRTPLSFGKKVFSENDKTEARKFLDWLRRMPQDLALSLCGFDPTSVRPPEGNHEQLRSRDSRGVHVGPLSKDITVESGYQEFLKWVQESSYAPSYQLDLRNTVHVWATRQNLWSRRIDTLNEGDVAGWLNSPKCTLGYTRKTVSKMHLNRFFKYCVSKRIIDFNPVELVRIDHRSMPQKKLEGRPKPFWTEEELDTVTEHATPEWKLMITLARDTGMRLGDIASLEWANWDRERNVIWRWTIKRNRRVEFAATERVASMLAAWPKTENSPYVFPEFAAMFDYSLKDVPQRLAPKFKLSAYFHKLALKTKVYRPGLNFHRIRATHARNLRKTHDLDAVRERLGHSNAYVTAGYTGEEYASERRKGA